MCLGAILLHRVSRVMFGSADNYGGAGLLMGHMPPFFEEVASQTEWLGPAYPKARDPLFARVMQLVETTREPGSAAPAEQQAPR